MTSVLVADDDPATVAFVQGVLRAEGYRVETASDGAAALDRAKAMRPDVLVTDLRMPGLSGNQLTAAVRALDRADYVYILVLTAAGEKPDKMKALLSGADDFLVKPARAGELLARVEVGLRLKRAEDEARAAARRRQEVVGAFGALADGMDGVVALVRGAREAAIRRDIAATAKACDEAAEAAARLAATCRARTGK